jgi:hypothetical protein
MIRTGSPGGKAPRVFGPAAIKSSRKDHTGLEPIIGSAVGIVRESAGLVCNIAALGLALVVGPQKATPRRAIVPMAANVIPFPATRNRKSSARNRM